MLLDSKIPVIISDGIRDCFSNIRVEPTEFSEAGQYQPEYHIYNIYIIEKNFGHIEKCHHLAQIVITDIIQIIVFPPIIRPSKLDVLDLETIKRWFQLNNVEGTFRTSLCVMLIFSLDLKNPNSIEVLINWIEYCGGLKTDKGAKT